jgi:hypothetical protein
LLFGRQEITVLHPFPSVQASVLNCLGDMGGEDIVAASQIRDRPDDPQNLDVNALYFQTVKLMFEELAAI